MDIDTIDTTLAWICFPDLSIIYYGDDLLRTFSSTVGKPVRVDRNTSLTLWGKFTWVCVELDLTKPLVAQFWIDEEKYIIDYKGLHSIYFHCGKFGHLLENYLTKDPNPKPSVKHVTEVVTPLVRIFIQTGH